MARIRILVEGKKVQNVGYRMFLLGKALESGIQKIYIRNLEQNGVEVLLDDGGERLDSFYDTLSSEEPKNAKIENIKKESYEGSMLIPPIERYFQFLTLEQLSKGREEVLKLPVFVGKSVDTVASALSGINEKFGSTIERFGVFGESAKEIDGKLNSMDNNLTVVGEELKEISEKLDTIATMPEKIDALPERIAEAISSSKKK